LNKWAFVHIPKTGGSSLSKLLLQQNGSEIISTHGDLGLFQNINDYFIFTIVRNPFTRFASAYLHKSREGFNGNFSDFINSIYEFDFWYYPQIYFFNHNKTSNIEITHICKYENYENDIRALLIKLKIPFNKIPHENRNPIYNKHPNLKQQDYYKILYNNNVLAKEWVLDKYKNDFKLFNYELDV
jgi:hypothetical protein